MGLYEKVLKYGYDFPKRNIGMALKTFLKDAK